MSFLNWTMGYFGRSSERSEYVAPRASRWGVTIDAAAARSRGPLHRATSELAAPDAAAPEAVPAMELAATFVVSAVLPETPPALAITAIDLDAAPALTPAAAALPPLVPAARSTSSVAPPARAPRRPFLQGVTDRASRATSAVRMPAFPALPAPRSVAIAVAAPVTTVVSAAARTLEGQRRAAWHSTSSVAARVVAAPWRLLLSLASYRPALALPRLGGLISRAQVGGAQWAGTGISGAGRTIAPPSSPRGTGGNPLLPGVSPQDMADEVIAGLFARPGRMFLTVTGMAIGLGALVATLGLASTAGNRVLGQFDALAATEIQARARFASTSPQAELLPWDASDRLLRLNGVVAAGTKSSVDVGDALVSTSPVFDPQRQSDFKLSVQAVSPSLYTAVRAELRSGRLPDAGHSQRAERVAVLGPAAAERLGIASVEQLPSIRIGDSVFLVIGILENVARSHDLLGAVIIPEGTARRDYRLLSPESVVIETAVGATNLISQQTPLALRPDDARAVQVASPPEPQRVRDAVESDLSVLFLVLGVVSLIVGAIGIANVTLISVIERTGEIGLRRAIGASRFHIAAQFLCESGAMGFAGGVLGASAGVLVVVGTSAYLGWTPVLNAGVPFAAPVVGALTGLISGLYPAMRAARLEPVEALRGGA